MAKQLFKLLSLLLVTVTLTSCSKANNTSGETSVNSITLYHHYEQKLFQYDTDRKAIISLDKTPNVFQFNFADDFSIFTSGDSINNKYSLLKLSNNDITELFTLGEQEALFPLASDGDTYYFIHTFYHDNGEEKTDQRALVKITKPSKKSRMEILDQATGYQFTHGVCIGDTLYFSAYHSESDNYSVYSINDKQAGSALELVQGNLDCPELFRYNNRLVTSDNSNIYIEDKTFKKGSVNYIYNNTLLDISVNSDNDLELSLTDIKNSEVYYSMKKNVSFVYNSNGTLLVYGEGMKDEVKVR